MQQSTHIIASYSYIHTYILHYGHARVVFFRSGYIKLMYEQDIVRYQVGGDLVYFVDIATHNNNMI